MNFHSVASTPAKHKLLVLLFKHIPYQTRSKLFICAECHFPKSWRRHSRLLKQTPLSYWGTLMFSGKSLTSYQLPETSPFTVIKAAKPIIVTVDNYLVLWTRCYRKVNTSLEIWEYKNWDISMESKGLFLYEKVLKELNMSSLLPECLRVEETMWRDRVLKCLKMPNKERRETNYNVVHSTVKLYKQWRGVRCPPKKTPTCFIKLD